MHQNILTPREKILAVIAGVLLLIMALIGYKTTTNDNSAKASVLSNDVGTAALQGQFSK